MTKPRTGLSTSRLLAQTAGRSFPLRNRVRELVALCAAFCALSGLVSCKDPAPRSGAQPLAGPTRHACDRRLPDGRALAKICIEYLGPTFNEASVRAKCLAVPQGRYQRTPCAAGAIGRCALDVGAGQELHELIYEGNFAEVARGCQQRGGVWKPE